MSEYKAVIDLGTKNLRLGIFDLNTKSVYSSKQIINDDLAQSLNTLIRDAEKHLSTHIDNTVVLYDSPKFSSLDISIKKVFDHSVPIDKVYESLIEEANFIVSQNNFKNQIIHLVVNNIIIDGNKKITKIIKNKKIKFLILEIKFICISKILRNEISNIFKKNNLKISNLYCSSYIKTTFYKKNFDNKDTLIFLDIGFERTSCFIFENDKYEFFNFIPIGGNNITKDISKVLKLNLDYSEDLKIKLNKDENEIFLNRNDFYKKNPFSEVLDKNISIGLLKQIIEARVKEIFELSLNKYYLIKNFSINKKPKIILFGGGSKLLPNTYKLNTDKIFSELVFFQEYDSNICEAGYFYSNSDESFYTQTKKREQKVGFFESFFNFFSK
ncbi:hypothetical protein IDG52_02135 [Pelagibacterales bacterium SAG-MED23]|nr:hypothetical protein [Pelagibacterales bacterium SAG-MED23]